MRTLTFLVLTVFVLVRGGDAVGQGPPQYTATFAWAKDSPWGQANQLECTVVPTSLPGQFCSTIDYLVCNDLYSTFETPDFQYTSTVSNSTAETQHIFDPKPPGPLRIEVIGTFTSSSLPTETKSVGATM